MQRLYFLLLLFLITETLFGQLCHRKYANDNCKGYLVTEVSLSYPISLGEKSVIRHWDASTNLGAMYDINPRAGVGGHFFYGFYMNGGGHTQYGVRLRASYYLKNDLEINFSPGLILSDSSYPDGFAGYSFETNFTWNDHLGISIRYDDLVRDKFRKDRYLHFGVQTDGIKGLGVVLSSFMVGIINRRRKQR